MNNQFMDLMYIRIKSFVTEASVMLLLGAIAVFQSEAFANLVTEEFGEVWGGGLGLLIVSGVVKHLLNLKVLSDHKNKVGGVGGPPVLI